MTENNKPIAQERNGGISLAVFNGEKGKGLVLQKSYKKKGDEEWQRQNLNLFFGELIKVKEVVDKICTQFPEDIKKAEEYAKQKAAE